MILKNISSRTHKNRTFYIHLFRETQRSSKQMHYYQHYTTDGTSIACTWTSKCRYPSLAVLCC